MSVDSTTSKSKDTSTSSSDVCQMPQPPLQVSIDANVEAAESHSSASIHQETTEHEKKEEKGKELQSQVHNNVKKENWEKDEMAIVNKAMGRASIAGDDAEQRRNEAVANAKAQGVPGTMRTGAGPSSKSSAERAKEARQQQKKKKRTPPPVQLGQSTGRWLHAEHEAFLEGLKMFGREWKKVAVKIPTRTSAQVRSHAQKYFSKLARDEQIMDQENQAFETAAASAATAAPAGSAVASEAEAAQRYTPSIQRNMERILADPDQAQRDVADMLGALRARYHLLQRRLEKSPPRRRPASNRVEDEIENEEKDDNDQQQDGVQQLEEEKARTSKRRRSEVDEDYSMSSSSALSSLGNEELIALDVLGATLPNGHVARLEVAQPQMEREGSSSSLESAASPGSSTTDDGRKTSKRKRAEK